jgi:hypothetical protein
MKLKKTRKEYEEYLNEVGIPEHEQTENEGRVPIPYEYKYGTWLRKHDPIAFNVGYNEWVRK